MIYILTGGPATGKGTRSDILAKYLGIPHVATGDMLREVAKTNDVIREIMEKGELISDEVITSLLEERIEREDCKEGFVLDGYPRTYNQAVLLDQLLEKHNRKITKVMELTVPDELAFKRILERKKYKCGGHLSVRTDDTRETLARRIETYRKNAQAILDHYKEKGLLMTVDASHNPESVIDDAKK